MSASIAEDNSRTTYRAGSNAPVNALSRVRGELPLPAYTVTSPTSALAWSDNGAGGTFQLSGTNNVNAVYTPKNKSQIVTISATDSANTKNITLNVTATLPLHPQVGYEVELDVETSIAYARDRTRYSREEGTPEMSWVFAWDNRDNVDQAEMATFWFDHKRIKQFYVYDVAQDIVNKVWFNSPIKFAPNNDKTRWAMSVGVSGVYQGLSTASFLPVVLKIDAGGFGAPPYQADQYSVRGTAFYWGGLIIDNSGVTSPAPDDVYQYCRFDTDFVEYQITGLRPSYAHTVRMHFCHSGAFTRVIQPMYQGVGVPNITLGTSESGVVKVDTQAGIISTSGGVIVLRANKMSGINAVISAIDVTES